MGSDIDEPGLDLLIEFILITLVKELGPSRGTTAKQTPKGLSHSHHVLRSKSNEYAQPHPNDAETAVVTSDSPPFSVVGRGTTHGTPHQPLQGGLRW